MTRHSKTTFQALSTAAWFFLSLPLRSSYAFSSISLPSAHQQASTTLLHMSASTPTTVVPSWSDLKQKSQATPVGSALNKEVQLRHEGKGSAHVQNKLRLFDSKKQPKITLYRDHAGWCPYCQKTMLLIEEKEIPIQIGLVNMRSYGDKPRDFLQKVPSGLLPAMEVDNQIITESQVIMELLDQWHDDEGYKTMLPKTGAGRKRYQQLAQLERELFSAWCTLLFRPEMPAMFGGSMNVFLDCMKQVDKELLSTDGPWFFDEYDHPTMIDFIYVSHVERMLASCAYWKGLNLRDPKYKLEGVNRWLEAFEQRESYLAFKSDYYTNVKDIPPQYGPSYDGGLDKERVQFQKEILGTDGSWTLPLSFDDPLQPLYRGLPLPRFVLEAMSLDPDSEGTYESCNHETMATACRHMAAWKLADNGVNVSRFAARGGPAGAKNVRKTFGAELADPYADPDDQIRPTVDSALRIVCAAMLVEEAELESQKDALLATVPQDQIEGVVSSLMYLRDRVGVPRDLPLAAARYLRAYLNWAIDILQ